MHANIGIVQCVHLLLGMRFGSHHYYHVCTVYPTVQQRYIITIGSTCTTHKLHWVILLHNYGFNGLSALRELGLACGLGVTYDLQWGISFI